MGDEFSPLSCRIRVHLFGPLEVSRRNADGTWTVVPKEEWGKYKSSRSVFKRLLAAPARRLSRGKLLEDLWPEIDGELADTYLYNAITRIRGVIGKPLVKTIDSIYEFADQSLFWVDSDACEALLKEAENQGRMTMQAVSLLEEALRLLDRGEYLEGEDGVWCHALRQKSEHMAKQCRLWLAEGYEAQGKLWQAGEHYRILLQTLPPDEDVLRAWIEMLCRHGKTQEALKCYQDVKERWEAQGVQLSRALEQQIASLRNAGELFINTAPALFGRLLGSPHAPAWPVWTESEMLSSLPIPPIEQPSTLGETLHINKETLPLFATLTDLCRHLSEGDELRVAERVLWTYLPKIELLARLPSEYQDTAATIASQGYLLAASLVGHRNDLVGRLRYSKQAFHYGELAGDLTLQTVAMRQIAISFDCMDSPDKVIEVSQRTFSHLEDVSPLLSSCIYAGVSGAYAEMGQQQEALRFMGLAYEQFPEHPEQEPGYLHTICRYSTLIFFDGLNHLDFGQPQKAEKILARIDGLQPKMPLPERVRVELLNYQIAVFLALNALEQACAYLEASTEAARAIGSERHFRDAFALFQRMQKTWRNAPQVRQLADLFLR